MNIFQKIKLINKVSKAVKEIKRFLDTTHIDKDIKDAIVAIKENVEAIVDKAPQLKEAYLTVLEILKS